MSSPTDGVRRAFERGVDTAAGRLAKLTRTSWQLQTVSLSQVPHQELGRSLSSPQDEGYGVRLSAPGLGFLLFLSHAAAENVARAFLGKSYSRARERAAVSETANIIINALVDAVAEAAGRPLLLDAPRAVEGALEPLLNAGFLVNPEAPMVLGFVHLSSPSLSADCTLACAIDGELRRALEAPPGGGRAA